MKNKNIILLLVLLSVMIIGGITLLVINQTPQLTTGFTSLSISNVEIIDSGSRIRIYGVANGAEQISINFNPSQLNQYISDEGYEATKSVTGSITMENPIREFYLSKDTTKIFPRFIWKGVSLLSSCENNAPSGSQTIGRIATSTCLYYTSDGTYSIFTGQYTDDTPITFNIGGSVGTINPNQGNNALTLSDGKTKIEWVGNLLNSQGLSTPSYAALFSGSQYSKLIDLTSYNSIENAKNTFVDCIGSTRANILSGLLIALFQADSKVRTCTDNYNNKLTTYLVDKTSNYVDSVNVNGAEFTSNGLKIDLKTASVFPTFIITLDASKVGIIELKGKPQIVSCIQSKIINSGDTYSSSIQVKNIGSNDGSFYGQVTCSGSSDVGGVISEQLVAAGTTANLPVQMSGINTESGTVNNNCIAKIIDRKSGDSVQCAFTIGVKYQANIVCSPNSITCKDSNTLKVCNADGTDFTTKNCDNGCIVLDSGEGQCKGQANNQTKCGFGQEYREQGKGAFWGLFASSSAGCYTSGFVYLTIVLVFLTMIITILVLIARRKGNDKN